jgi:hypothetical protein
MRINHLINPNYSSDFNKLFDRVFEQIVEEELMDNTSEDLRMRGDDNPTPPLGVNVQSIDIHEKVINFFIFI